MPLPPVSFRVEVPRRKDVLLSVIRTLMPFPGGRCNVADEMQNGSCRGRERLGTDATPVGRGRFGQVRRRGETPQGRHCGAAMSVSEPRQDSTASWGGHSPFADEKNICGP